MQETSVLAKQADELNRQAGQPAIPALYFFTDPVRTPDPVRIARRLPPGAAVVYRHFGAADRARVARALARVCRQRGLVLLIAADPNLARRVGADGVHWPERRSRCAGRHAGLSTVAVHSDRAARRVERAHALVLAPVLPTHSASANPPLGLFKAARVARGAHIPVIALGGINAGNAHRFSRRGFAGLGCVEGLADA
jgi:thiamine-phosphate pyrophosphorylase